MDETYLLKAIILKREPFRENDTRVVVYSAERGRSDLVARGTKRIKSKLAGHLEPLTLSNIMAIKGKQFDYAGSARGEYFFTGIKTDFEKLESAGKAISFFLGLVKPSEPDEIAFRLVEDFLKALDEKNNASLGDFFILKLLAHSGYRPELFRCVACRRQIRPAGNRFDSAKGGLVCPACSRAGNYREAAVSDDCIKVLRLVLESDFQKLIKVEISDKLASETGNIISSFAKYGHG